ncbi:MAG: YceI family protein, partial [Bacteroidia bacterium]|nr:YceI family protein [Bacteroidia bacterium]
IAGLTMTIACTKAPEAQQAQTGEAQQVQTTASAEELTVASTSSVKWIGTKVTGRHNGTFAIQSGTLKIEGSELKGGKIVLDMTKLTVEDLKGDLKGKLEGHLKDKDFFDVTKNPTAEFEITSVVADTSGGATHKITGNLTLRGVTKSVTFPAKVQVDPAAKTVSATANFNINRKDWGISYEGKKDDLIRDEVNIDLNITASKAQS